jgi:2-amino-4-hydroxy-6-hydroxymethyldihydropteridine diphosphokinase/dihydropteroate synthase
MAIYLGLGSNSGDRRDNLRTALTALGKASIRVKRVSPVVESPALLPPDAPPDWNSPFLNLVVECTSTLGPDALLTAVKRIEQLLGRCDARRWAPRPIDIDILTFNDEVVQTEKLSIPHRALPERAFVLTPLAALNPGLKLPVPGASGGALTALGAVRALDRAIPLWMGIVNLTPDSFSDGGETLTWPAVESRIDRMIGSGVHILDFGAESTRPGASPLTANEEWSRLAPILEQTFAKFAGDLLRPKISVDTYHAEVARNSLQLGVDIVNDVSGLTRVDMIELAAASEADFIAMHNLGLPADPTITLDRGRNAVDQVAEWLDRQIELWQRNQLDLNRIIFDPGIGFGKNPLQSLELLRDIDRFSDYGLRLLVGHSRKSFMKGLADDALPQRDLVTVGSSLALCEHSVDILRVHNVADHVTAWRGWAHVQQPGKRRDSAGGSDQPAAPVIPISLPR